MVARLEITNKQARALWLRAQGLGRAPTGPLDVMAIIEGLGFVQLDTIQVVSRAHHHIIWSRNQNYREPMLDRLLARDRAIFEHFTHDASVIPMAFLPYWKRQFDRKRDEYARASWAKGLPGPDVRDAIKARIAAEGPLSTQAFDTKVEGKKEMWSRPPHKRALDYMWNVGELATCHRVNFTKYYDLAERVFPECETVNDKDQVDWLCEAALIRLGAANASEIKRFWEAASPAEVKDWLDRADLIPALVQGADGSWTDAFGPPDIQERLAGLEPPTTRLRMLNPFDPVIRDRDRLLRLFGFYYRVEMFVPAAKRQWGYYVFPLLEGDRFIGRIEAKADRGSGALNVLRLWSEPGVRWTDKRHAKLEAELARMARFIGVERVDWQCSVVPEAAEASRRVGRS